MRNLMYYSSLEAFLWQRGFTASAYAFVDRLPRMRTSHTHAHMCLLPDACSSHKQHTHLTRLHARTCVRNARRYCMPILHTTQLNTPGISRTHSMHTQHAHIDCMHSAHTINARTRSADRRAHLHAQTLVHTHTHARTHIKSMHGPSSLHQQRPISSNKTWTH